MPVPSTSGHQSLVSLWSYLVGCFPWHHIGSKEHRTVWRTYVYICTYVCTSTPSHAPAGGNGTTQPSHPHGPTRHSALDKGGSNYSKLDASFSHVKRTLQHPTSTYIQLGHSVQASCFRSIDGPTEQLIDNIRAASLTKRSKYGVSRSGDQLSPAPQLARAFASH